MTEKIKSAIEALKLTRDTRFFIPKNEVLELSILSLKAWEDVLQELEEVKQNFKNDGNIHEAIAVNISIKKIKQKLEGIGGGE